MNESTVYRTLDTLERLGYLHHVHLGHGPGVVHLTEDKEHHHLVCERCARTIDLPLSEMGPLLDDLSARHGFQTGSIHFALMGLCQECSLNSS